MSDPAARRPDASLRRYLVASAAVLLLLGGAVLGWAANAPLAGAVIAPGTVVVDSNSKRVQHPTGGVVGELRVRDGAAVRENDILVRLDETTTRANHQILVKQLDEIAMRRERLRAERDGAAAVQLPASLASRQSEPPIAELIKGEFALFESRRGARASERAQLRERIVQLRQEIEGLRGQHAAVLKQSELITAELADLEPLFKRGLVQLQRYNPIRREAARLEGVAGQVTSQMAQSAGRITEIELQVLRGDEEFRSEVVKELRETLAREAELSERRIVAEDLLQRVDIRAPQSGIVHQLQVHTIGGVVNPGETLMMIVPEDDKRVVEARVQQQDIEQLRLDQPALLRMTAFNTRTTPELVGKVQRIGADLVREPQTGLTYFNVRIVIAEDEVQKLGGGRLLPGMPVDVQIRTEERTALSYMIRPLTDQMARAFRER